MITSFLNDANSIRFLRYLREDDQQWGVEGINDPINLQNDPINQQSRTQDDPINQLGITKINSVFLNPQESAQAEAIADNDQTQPEQPMDVQAEVQKNPEPTDEKELIKDVFQKIGWEKYIKEESIIGGQNVNGQNS